MLWHIWSINEISTSKLIRKATVIRWEILRVLKNWIWWHIYTQQPKNYFPTSKCSEAMVWCVVTTVISLSRPISTLIPSYISTDVMAKTNIIKYTKYFSTVDFFTSLTQTRGESFFFCPQRIVYKTVGWWIQARYLHHFCTMKEPRSKIIIESVVGHWPSHRKRTICWHPAQPILSDSWAVNP